MANDLLRGRQTVAYLTNKSGGGVVAGDVVILDSSTAASFTSTTSAAQTEDWVGVVLETIASNASGRVCMFGYVPLITLASSASLGDYVRTHTVAKQAQRFSSAGTGDFGQVLGTGTTPAAILWGHPQASSGGASITEHSYVEVTSPLTVTATTDATAQTFVSSAAVAYNGSTRVKIECFCPLIAPAASQAIVINLYDGATDLGELGEVVIGQSTFLGVRYLTPSNATHTYHFKVWKTSGAATAHAGAGGTATLLPGYIRITTA